MNLAHPPVPDDATLVAWLDGELSADAAGDVQQAVQRDARLQHRVQMLGAARAELTWALERPDAAPPALPRLVGPRRRTPSLLVGLVAAAAAIVVVLLALEARRTSRDEFAENEWLQLRLVPVQPVWDLFSPIRFELEGTAKTATPCEVVLKQPKETDAQLADRLVAEPAVNPSLPLLLEAEVTGPDGVARRGSVVRTAGRWTQNASRLQVELVDVWIPHPGINPTLNVALVPGAVREDFLWGIQRSGTSDAGGVHGCIPEQAGSHRIRFFLRSFAPASDSRFRKFTAPLEVATGFVVTGAVGAWSAPVDGMRARIAVSTAHPEPGRQLVFAVQLRNESDRARMFNISGITMAKIPQPFHFDLLVDGEPWTQRRDLRVVTPAMSTGLELAAGGERSSVVVPEFWEHGAGRFADLTGKHTLAVRFHFEASVWMNDDKTLWQGKIDTPPIDVELPPTK